MPYGGFVMRIKMLIMLSVLFLCTSCGKTIIAEKPRSECLEKTFSAGAASGAQKKHRAITGTPRFTDTRSIAVQLDRPLAKKGLTSNERKIVNEIEMVLSRRGFAVSESSEPDEFELELQPEKKAVFDAELVIDSIRIEKESYAETLEFTKGEYAVYTYPYYRAEISGCIKNLQGAIIWRDTVTLTSFDVFIKEKVPVAIKITAEQIPVYSQKLAAWQKGRWNYTATDTFTPLYSNDAKAASHCHMLIMYAAEEFLREVTR